MEVSNARIPYLGEKCNLCHNHLSEKPTGGQGELSDKEYRCTDGRLCCTNKKMTLRRTLLPAIAEVPRAGRKLFRMKEY
jgi:hypothetical protein